MRLRANLGGTLISGNQKGRCESGLLFYRAEKLRRLMRAAGGDEGCEEHIVIHAITGAATGFGRPVRRTPPVVGGIEVGGIGVDTAANRGAVSRDAAGVDAIGGIAIVVVNRTAS